MAVDKATIAGIQYIGKFGGLVTFFCGSECRHLGSAGPCGLAPLAMLRVPAWAGQGTYSYVKPFEPPWQTSNGSLSMVYQPNENLPPAAH